MPPPLASPPGTVAVLLSPSSIVTPVIEAVVPELISKTPDVTEHETPMHWAWITGVAEGAAATVTELELFNAVTTRYDVRTWYCGAPLVSPEELGRLTVTAPLRVAASANAARNVQFAVSSPGVQLVAGCASSPASVTLIVVAAPAGEDAMGMSAI